MDSYLKVVDHDSLVRDRSSHAILNTNKGDYEAYIARRNASLTQKEELEKQGKEIEELKGDLSEIKQMLTILINKQ